MDSTLPFSLFSHQHLSVKGQQRKALACAKRVGAHLWTSRWEQKWNNFLFPLVHTAKQCFIIRGFFFPGRECQKFMALEPAYWMPAHKQRKDKTLREIRSHLENKPPGNLQNFNGLKTTTTFYNIFLSPFFVSLPKQAILSQRVLSCQPFLSRKMSNPQSEACRSKVRSQGTASILPSEE